MPRVVWLVRHANRQDFVDPTWRETADRPHDPGLSPDGWMQARHLARRFADAAIDRIVASPFLRTVQTAHAVAEARRQPLYLEPGLGEWLNPAWFDAAPTLLPPDTLTHRFEHVDLDHRPCHRPSFPESRDAMIERMGAAARCLVRRYIQTDALLLVGHGATVSGVLRGLVHDDLPEAGCPLASVTRLVRRAGRWTIAQRNDTAHLDKAIGGDRFQ